MGASPSRAPKTNQYPAATLTVDELCSHLNTGDLIFFQGYGVRAWGVRMWEWSDYSHVGMVHRRTFPGMSDPEVCLWESVGHLDHLHCLLHNRQKTGPRLVSLRDKLNSYIAESGDLRLVKVCVVQLLPQPMEAAGVLDRNLCAFQDQICGRAMYPSPYELSAEELWSTLPIHAAPPPQPMWHLPMGDHPHIPTHNRSYTCVQLVTTTLVRMQAYNSTLDVDRVHLRGILDGYISEQDRRLAVLDVNNFHWTVKPPSPPSFLTVSSISHDV